LLLTHRSKLGSLNYSAATVIGVHNQQITFECHLLLLDWKLLFLEFSAEQFC